MKKEILFLLLLFLATRGVCAQIDWGDYSQSFPDGTTDDPSTVALILAIPKDNNSFWSLNADSRHYADLARDSSFQQVRHNLVARTTFDTAQAHFFLHGVNLENASSYRFRVMEYPTKRVLVPWQRIDRFTDSTLIKSSTLPRMAYLGGYKAPLGRSLIMDVRKVGSQKMATASLISWVPIKPVITSVYTSDNLDAFFKKLQYPWAREDVTDHTVQTSDLLTLPSPNNNLILLLGAKIYHKEQVQYELSRDGRIVIPWKENDYDNSFIWLKDNEPGAYRLKIRYAIQPTHVKEYRFVVEPTWYQSRNFRIMSGIILLVVVGAIYLLFLFIRQKQKSRRELANKTKLQLELKTIYAQLNPHFVFNALGSIQSLINKRNIEGANSYLSDFARLMRESLTNSNREEISLHEEIQGLETYLRLEQLRFGFKYRIIVDKTINPYDSGIPALLLQPLVENAVKHGVSALGKDGQIDIRFDRTSDIMIVGIADNGKGFVARAPASGFGLKLTRDRLELLNQLNKEQLIQFEVTPQKPSGTEITLRFNHWFA